MGFCPQCGRPAEVGMSFCASCGAAITPSAVPSVPAARPNLSRQRGPVGQTTEPIVVLLLILVTLGIYTFFYWWRVSKETDAFTGQPGHAHGKVRLGILLYVGSLALLIPGYVMFIAGILGAEVDPTTGEPSGEAIASLGTSFLLLLAGGVLGIVGVVFKYIGIWRVWRAIEDDERRRLPNPLSPGLQLFFHLMPYVNWVTFWIAHWRTQTSLNDMWAATAAPPVFAPVPPGQP